MYISVICYIYIYIDNDGNQWRNQRGKGEEDATDMKFSNYPKENEEDSSLMFRQLSLARGGEWPHAQGQLQLVLIRTLWAVRSHNPVLS